jgi:hypothetical protein
MNLNKKSAQDYYKEVQDLLDKYKTDPSGTKVDWWSVCRDLFSLANPVISQEDLRDECADYAAQKTENSAWTFSIYVMPWLLYNLKMKTQDGHCHSPNHGHGMKDPKCKVGSKFHNDLYAKCLNSFNDILKELENDPPKPIT